MSTWFGFDPSELENQLQLLGKEQLNLDTITILTAEQKQHLENTSDKLFQRVRKLHDNSKS